MVVNPSDWAVRHRGVVGLLIVLLFVGGAWSFHSLGRAEDPETPVPIAVVSATWPGATALEMQDQVADRLERKLRELAWVDYLETYSLPGISVTQVRLRDATPPADMAELWYQIRKKLDDIRPALPAAASIAVNDEYSDVYAALFALTGANNADLVRQAEHVRDRLLRVPGTEKAQIVGEIPRTVFVTFSPGRLASLGVTVPQIARVLARRNAITPAGEFGTTPTRTPVRVDGELTGADAVAATPISAGGHVVDLRSLAEVSNGYKDPPDFAVHHDGKPAVVLAVSMARGDDGLEFGRRLRVAADAARADLPAGIEMRQIEDQSAVIHAAVDEYLVKFAIAIGVVLLVSFISLGLRAGLVVALSIPLTLAMVFLVMDALGIALQRVSLGALIIALGLLVDDAIIAVEMMAVKLREGLDRRAAASAAWTLTAAPMLTGTLVTAVAFLPVGLARSTTGTYAGGIFWVVTLALLCSFGIVMIFTPVLGVLLLRPVRPESIRTSQYDSLIYRTLRHLVTNSVRHRILIVVGTVLLFLTVVAGLTKVRQQFFPLSTRAELILDVTLRPGASFAATEDAVDAVEARLALDPDIAWFTSYIGAGPPRFYLAAPPALPNPATATIVIAMHDAAARERVRERLLRLEADSVAPSARLRVSRMELGPPVGFPVSFRVIGPDLEELRRIGAQVLAVLRATPGSWDAQLAWGDRVPALRVTMDQARMSRLGVDPEDVADTLQTVLTGVTATSILDGTKRVNVVLRGRREDRVDPSRLPDLSVAMPSGAVLLSQLARVSIDMEEPILWRRNSEPMLTVQSDVTDGVEAPDVSAAAQRLLASVQLLPGYRIETGSAAEESAKANTALFAVFPLMCEVIVVLLMLQLQNVRRMLLVLATAPLGIIGAVPALLLVNAPMGFVALLGMIALSGMVMRNSLILVDQVRQNQVAGMAVHEAIIASAVRRARPVALTALAAILAFVPLSLNAFWGPMAIIMIGGLTVATVLTLVFEPALYAMTSRVGLR